MDRSTNPDIVFPAAPVVLVLLLARLPASASDAEDEEAPPSSMLRELSAMIQIRIGTVDGKSKEKSLHAPSNGRWSQEDNIYLKIYQV